MKRFHCRGLFLLILLVVATVAVACGGEDTTPTPRATGPAATLAPTVTPQAGATSATASPSSPEDIVRTFFDTIGAGDSEKTANLLIPERAKEVNQLELPRPPILNLTVKKLGGRGYRTGAGWIRCGITHQGTRRCYRQTNGQWLISNMDDPPSPEDTVRALIDAMGAGDSERMASLGIPENAEQIRQVNLPKLTISNLNVQKLSETEDTAEVAAGYDVESSALKIDGHVDVSVTLVKTNGQWLISEMNEVQTETRVEVLVHDEADVPVAGAKVTIGNAEKEIIRTEITDTAGLAEFGEAPAPDNIIATRDGYTPSRGWGFVSGEPYKVRLESAESMAQKKEHAVLTVVEPPVLTIPQGGSAKAIASVYSFGRPSRVSLRLQDGLDPSTKFDLESTPDELTLADTGQADIELTIRVASGTEPGVYRVNVAPVVLEDLRPQGVGEGYGAGGATLMIKVKAPE